MLRGAVCPEAVNSPGELCHLRMDSHLVKAKGRISYDWGRDGGAGDEKGGVPCHGISVLDPSGRSQTFLIAQLVILRI